MKAQINAGWRSSGTPQAAVPTWLSRPREHDSTSRNGVIIDDPRDAARFARQVRDSGLSRSALDHLDGEVGRYATDYISRPVSELFVDIRELRGHVFQLVENNRFPDQMVELYLQGSRLSGLQAHTCLDLGHYRAAYAHAHTHTAFLCAELAGHNRMRASVRGLQSVIAYWDGKLSDAVDYAKDGVRYGGRGSIAARLPSLEARACAARRDKGGAIGALQRAESARDLIGGSENESGVFTFPAAKQAVYASTTLLALGDQETVARAKRESSRALALYDAATPGDRSSGDILAAKLDLGRAHLMQSDLDGLAEQLQTVLTVPRACRTASIVKRAASIGKSLAASKYVTSRQSTQIRAEIASFCSPRPALPLGPSHRESV